MVVGTGHWLHAFLLSRESVAICVCRVCVSSVLSQAVCANRVVPDVWVFSVAKNAPFACERAKIFLSVRAPKQRLVGAEPWTQERAAFLY